MLFFAPILDRTQAQTATSEDTPGAAQSSYRDESKANNSVQEKCKRATGHRLETSIHILQTDNEHVE